MMRTSDEYMWVRCGPQMSALRLNLNSEPQTRTPDPEPRNSKAQPPPPNLQPLKLDAGVKP